MDINIIIQKLIMLFIPISFGYACRKANYFGSSYAKHFSRLMTEITVPALLFSSIVLEESSGRLGEIITVLLASIAIFFTFSLISIILPKIFHIKKADIGIYKFFTVFNNNAFMGFPVLAAILGTKALFYGALYNIINNVFIFTIGLYFIGLSSKQPTKFNLKKLLNTVNCSIFLALIIFFIKIPIPEVIISSTKLVGDITTPLSMIIIGISLAEVKFLEIFTSLKLYIMSILKMVIFPLLLWLVLKNIISFNELLINSLVIISAMPGAAIAVTLATQYDANQELASKYILLSTILSIITIPFVVAIITHI